MPAGSADSAVSVKSNRTDPGTDSEVSERDVFAAFGARKKENAEETTEPLTDSEAQPSESTEPLPFPTVPGRANKRTMTLMPGGNVRQSVGKLNREVLNKAPASRSSRSNADDSSQRSGDEQTDSEKSTSKGGRWDMSLLQDSEAEPPQRKGILRKSSQRSPDPERPLPVDSQPALSNVPGQLVRRSSNRSVGKAFEDDTSSTSSHQRAKSVKPGDAKRYEHKTGAETQKTRPQQIVFDDTTETPRHHSLAGSEAPSEALSLATTDSRPSTKSLDSPRAPSKAAPKVLPKMPIKKKEPAKSKSPEAPKSEPRSEAVEKRNALPLKKTEKKGPSAQKAEPTPSRRPPPVPESSDSVVSVFDLRERNSLLRASMSIEARSPRQTAGQASVHSEAPYRRPEPASRHQPPAALCDSSAPPRMENQMRLVSMLTTPRASYADLPPFSEGPGPYRSLIPESAPLTQAPLAALGSPMSKSPNQGGWDSPSDMKGLLGVSPNMGIDSVASLTQFMAQQMAENRILAMQKDLQRAEADNLGLLVRNGMIEKQLDDASREAENLRVREAILEAELAVARQDDGLTLSGLHSAQVGVESGSEGSNVPLHMMEKTWKEIARSQAKIIQNLTEERLKRQMEDEVATQLAEEDLADPYSPAGRGRTFSPDGRGRTFSPGGRGRTFSPGGRDGTFSPGGRTFSPGRAHSPTWGRSPRQNDESVERLRMELSTLKDEINLFEKKENNLKNKIKKIELDFSEHTSIAAKSLKAAQKKAHKYYKRSKRLESELAKLLDKLDSLRRSKICPKCKQPSDPARQSRSSNPSRDTQSQPNRQSPAVTQYGSVAPSPTASYRSAVPGSTPGYGLISSPSLCGAAPAYSNTQHPPGLTYEEVIYENLARVGLPASPPRPPLDAPEIVPSKASGHPWHYEAALSSCFSQLDGQNHSMRGAEKMRTFYQRRNSGSRKGSQKKGFAYVWKDGRYVLTQKQKCH